MGKGECCSPSRVPRPLARAALTALLEPGARPLPEFCSLHWLLWLPISSDNPVSGLCRMKAVLCKYWLARLSFFLPPWCFSALGAGQSRELWGLASRTRVAGPEGEEAPAGRVGWKAGVV